MRYSLRTGVLLLAMMSSCASEQTDSSDSKPGQEAMPDPVSVEVSSGEVMQPSEVSEEADQPACLPGMALVEGNYCLTPIQHCIEWQRIAGANVSRGQCLRYAEPVTCFEDRRRSLRFCMDRFEWPNQRGQLPRMLTSWQEARALCASVQKRLCTADEFNFACEGEAMRPYVYGYTRDASRCNIDRPYRPRTFNFTSWDNCQADLDCRKAFEAIDQRVVAGSLPDCRSEHGIYDLNGNANEWVYLPDRKSPYRSGIKGGWWGPVRNRCRPTVTFHDEGDFGYEVGFRCCAEAGNGE